MSEFLLELYSEEIPPQLQINARTQLKQQLENSFEEEGIQYKDCLEYSSPTRLSIYIKGIPEKIKIKSKEIKGPKVGVPENILQGFTKSRNVSEKDLFKKETEKVSQHYFFWMFRCFDLRKLSSKKASQKNISKIDW